MATINSKKSMSKSVPADMSNNWRPNWWQEENVGSTWERVKAAVVRDWQQTKHDLHAGGHELHQDIQDTVKQAAGSERIPSDGGMNPAKVIGELSEAEMPIGYGYGARSHYGQQFQGWNEDVEDQLRSEWESGKPPARWEQVREQVKYGFEYKH